METWVHVGWVLIRNGDTGVRLLETLVCAFWVVTSNGNMGLCLFVAKQHRTHEIVHIE